MGLLATEYPDLELIEGLTPTSILFLHHRVDGETFVWVRAIYSDDCDRCGLLTLAIAEELGALCPRESKWLSTVHLSEPREFSTKARQAIDNLVSSQRARSEAKRTAHEFASESGQRLYSSP
jgi:hypothetical protein